MLEKPRARDSFGHRLVRLLTGVVLLISGFGFAAAQPGSNPSADPTGHGSRHILVLNSYHYGYAWAQNVLKGMLHVFDQIKGIDVSIEFMDAKRFAGDGYEQLMRSMLDYKYEPGDLDLIVASDDNALEFLLKHRDQMFGPVPVVFCGINEWSEERRLSNPLYTGIVEKLDHRNTLTLASRLSPAARHVVVIHDQTHSSQAIIQDVRQSMKLFENRFEFREITGISYEQLAQAVSQLHEDSLVLLMPYVRDSLGQTLPVSESVGLIRSHCAVPIYTCWDMQVGLGALGGYVTSGFSQGETAARQALRILEGESPSTIPVIYNPPGQYLFDWRELERFDIPASVLPEGSVFLNRPHQFYREHRLQILALAGAFAFLLIVVGGLGLVVVHLRRAQAQVRSSEARFRVLTEKISDVTAILDRQGIYQYISPSIHTVTDLTHDQITGQSFTQFIHPDDILLAQKCFEHALAKPGETITCPPMRCVGPAGQWRSFETQLTNLLDVAGINGVVISSRDVTQKLNDEIERRNLEGKIQQTQKLESLGVLAGGVAHDFNNLLVAILGHTDLAMMDIPADAPAYQSLSEIQRASLRAADLCGQMLAYSGKGKFLIERIDINQLIIEINSMIRVSVYKKIMLVLDLAEHVPRIRADANQVKQVVMNLISNASEAIGDAEGEIVLRTGAVHCDRAYLHDCYLGEEAQEGQYIFLEVQDTGSGMDPQTQEKIFEPFFTTKFTGRGLGMAAVLGIVRGHYGAIFVQSQSLRGTTVRILLPTEKHHESHAKTSALEDEIQDNVMA